MTSWQALQQRLAQLEDRYHREYKSIKGHYEFPDFEFPIDVRHP